MGKEERAKELCDSIEEKIRDMAIHMKESTDVELEGKIVNCYRRYIVGSTKRDSELFVPLEKYKNDYMGFWNRFFSIAPVSFSKEEKEYLTQSDEIAGFSAEGMVVYIYKETGWCLHDLMRGQ